MKYNFLFAIYFLTIGCNFNPKKDPYSLLTEYSKLKFDKSNVELINLQNQTSGGFKDEGIMTAVFEIKHLNVDSLKPILSDLKYKKLPIDSIDIGNGFNKNLELSDSGYYRIDLSHEGIISELVIINFSKKRIIYYKLI
jgi:hypothetical protein